MTLLERLGVCVPIVQATMEGGPDTPGLAATVTNAGGLGSLGCAYLSAEGITAAIASMRALTSGSFGVNLFVRADSPDEDATRIEPILAAFRAELGSHRGAPRPAPSYRAQLDAVIAARPRVVSFTFGAPSRDDLALVRAAGIVVIGTATTLDEAEALDALATELGLSSYTLFGHSDGASIALLHASTSARVAGVVALAPHLFVEGVTITSIRAAKDNYEALRLRLSRYHDDVDAAFSGWSDTWLDPAFRSWSIREEVARVRCPVLAIQGREDEYGTLAQLGELRRLAPQTETVVLDACGHSPHRDQPRRVISAAVAWSRSRR